ncbi:hypothetical protein [Bacillus thuringiensis]|nr:hypothetical protein [Bacillus thuringiensis]
MSIEYGENANHHEYFEGTLANSISEEMFYKVAKEIKYIYEHIYRSLNAIALATVLRQIEMG